MKIKNLLSKSVIAWGVTSTLLVVLLSVGNILARGTYSSLLDQVFGKKEAIVSEEDTGIVFEQDFFTKEEALENGNKVTEEICEEGMILLKNEIGIDGKAALPLKAGARVSIFGKNSVNLVYGGSGSAAPGDGARKTIYESLEDAGFTCNPALKSFYENNGASGDGRSSNPAMENSGVKTLKTGETPQSSYPGTVTSTYGEYDDAAIVVFSRIAGENWDLPRKADDNENRHYLELDNNERDLLTSVCNGPFKHVIVLMNSSNYIDLGFLEMTNDPAYNAKIDAAINIGSPGANGIMALGRILAGDVNPSGRTVNTVYTHYENDPTWQNFGGNFTQNGDNYLLPSGNPSKYYLVEYEENIYLGYRYYETRGQIDGEEWYNENVVYPFGFGLSYTTFKR
jgi:beta-glucosidase